MELTSDTAYLIIPIYNIHHYFDKNILNMEIVDGFKILYREDFKRQYFKQLTEYSTSITNVLNTDITPDDNIILFRSITQYLLFKEIHFSKEINIDEWKNIQVKEMKNVDNLLQAMRLVQEGMCQLAKGYFYTENYQSVFYLNLSAFAENIDTQYYLTDKEVLTENWYHLTIENINRTKNLYNMINSFQSNVFDIPFSYWEQYYISRSFYDKIIKLSILAESTLLSDCNDELKYRLSIRASNILGQNVTEIFKLFYDIRSGIVHSGTVTKANYKKINKLLNNSENFIDSYKYKMKLLFDFIKKIESYLREITLKYIETAYTKKLKSFNSINDYFDIQINNKLAQPYEEEVNIGS